MFDLTQPPALAQNKPPQKQPNEVKTMTVSMAPKKEVSPTASP